MRDDYGTSLVLLSQASGVPLATINDLDSGRSDITNASFMTVYRLSKALGCKPADLVGDLPRVRRAKKRLRALPKSRN